MKPILLLLALAAFGGSATSHAAVRVVATTTMVADLVRQVGGDRVEVRSLMGPGVDPHLYKPTAGDIIALQKAGVVFYSGLMLEGQMGELFERLSKTGKRIHAVADAIPKNELIAAEDAAGHPDPHVWGDARLWSLCVDAVVKGLTDADPNGIVEYRKRGDGYQAELERLHAWAKKRAGEIDPGARVLVTSHDAFNYLGRAYGFTVVGIQGISTVTEAGSADIVKAVDFIKEKGVKAVFVETSVARATIDRISKDSGAKIGGELFSDAMAAPGTKETVNGETYDAGTLVGMLKHNINTVIEALK